MTTQSQTLTQDQIETIELALKAVRVTGDPAFQVYCELPAGSPEAKAISDAIGHLNRYRKLLEDLTQQ